MSVLRGRVNCECSYVHDLVEVPGPTIWRALHDTEGGACRRAHRAQDRLQELVLGSPNYQDLPEYQNLLWADSEMSRILTFIFECPAATGWSGTEATPTPIGSTLWRRSVPNPALRRPLIVGRL
ncbi:MAG: hypothetical protein JNM56_39675 [Planctomycetia bacterium]|nr:hypothetical protein [Planctomycetia bacterium]